MLNRQFLVLAWISAAAAAACGGGGDETTGPQTGRNNTPPPAGGISVTNNAFSPAEKTIPTGTTVTWAWNTCSGGDVYGPETCVAHSVIFDDGTTSASQEKGTYTRTFSTAGSYPYHCAIHGTAMAGRIVVQ
jgi:plastocyanin